MTLGSQEPTTVVKFTAYFVVATTSLTFELWIAGWINVDSYKRRQGSHKNLKQLWKPRLHNSFTMLYIYRVQTNNHLITHCCGVCRYMHSIPLCFVPPWNRSALSRVDLSVLVLWRAFHPPLLSPWAQRSVGGDSAILQEPARKEQPKSTANHAKQF